MNNKRILIGCGGAGKNIIDACFVKHLARFSTIKCITIDMNEDNLLVMGQSGHLTEEKSLEPFTDITAGLIPYLEADRIMIVTGLGGIAGGTLASRLTQFTLEKQIETFVVAIYPFQFEGHYRHLVANGQLASMQKHCSVTKLIRTDDVAEYLGMDTPLLDLFIMIEQEIFDISADFLGI